jgi:DNA replication protein DnaC
MFSVRKVSYTEPSRLIGHCLKVHLYDDRLECFLGVAPVLTLPRGRVPPGAKRGYVVDYRHVLPSLRRKPQALRNLVWRDELFPRPAFRRAWDALTERLPIERACRTMVVLLDIAYCGGCEAELARHIEGARDAGEAAGSDGVAPSVRSTEPARRSWVAGSYDHNADGTRLRPAVAGYDRGPVMTIHDQATDHWSAVVAARRAIRPRRLASSPLSRHSARARARRALSTAHPASPPGGRAAGGQKLGHIRLRRSCDDQHEQITALAAGGSWLNKGANILTFGPSGVGKSHLAAALGQALVENGYRVLFTRTTDLVQGLQAARRDFTLEGAMDKLDEYDLLILDDISYVRKDQAETGVLFELISARYERRSLLITANQPFGKWDDIFPDKAMTVFRDRPPRSSHRNPRNSRDTPTSSTAVRH